MRITRSDQWGSQASMAMPRIITSVASVNWQAVAFLGFPAGEPGDAGHVNADGAGHQPTLGAQRRAITLMPNSTFSMRQPPIASGPSGVRFSQAS